MTLYKQWKGADAQKIMKKFTQLLRHRSLRKDSMKLKEMGIGRDLGLTLYRTIDGKSLLVQESR